MKKLLLALGFTAALAACKKEAVPPDNTDVRGRWRSVNVSGGWSPDHADNSFQLEIGDTTLKYWMRDSLAFNTTYTLVKHPFGQDTPNTPFLK